MNLINVKKDVLNRTTTNSMSLIDRKKMNAESFKDSSERDFKLWSFFILIADKQQKFWKRSSQIFIILLFLLKFLRAFEIILCSSVNLWFIIRSTFHDLTAITQLRNILIHFIRYIFLSTWHYLVYIRSLEHIKFSLLFSWLCNLSHLIWKSTQISHFSFRI